MKDDIATTYLMARARMGDQAAFSALLRANRGLLIHAISPFRVPGEDRNDLLQCASLTLWRALNDYDPQGGMAWSSFLVMCVKRAIITHLKHETSLHLSPLCRAISLDALLESDSDEVESADVADPCAQFDTDLIEELDLRDRLNCLRGALTHREREVFDAVCEQGESIYQDVAAHLHCSVKAVDNTLIRIRAKARSVLARESGGWMYVGETLRPRAKKDRKKVAQRTA